MKSAWFGLCLAAVISLQGCSKSVTPAGAPPGAAGPGQIPQSRQYFEEARGLVAQMQKSRAAKDSEGERQNAAQAVVLLDKAIEAAKTEKNYHAAVFCAEEQAKVKLAQNDNAGAVATLETSIKTFDVPGLDVSSAENSVRLDQSKALLASIYAVAAKNPGKADSLYKESLQRAREQKPINHGRVAFWLGNYANFYKYQKNDRVCRAMLKEAQSELAKDPQYVQAMAAQRRAAAAQK
jgi:hypothetical protein